MIVLSKNCTPPYHQALKILRALDSLHFPCKVNSSLSSEVKFGFPGTGGFLMISVPPNAKGWARNGLTWLAKTCHDRRSDEHTALKWYRYDVRNVQV